MKPTFTIILEYKGGTYVSQVKADDEKDALRKWATELNVKEIDGMGVKSKEILINSLDIDWNQPVLLNGLTNVWYWCYTLRGEFAYLHCVKTSFE